MKVLNVFKKFAFNTKVPVNVQNTYPNSVGNNSWNENALIDRTVGRYNTSDDGNSETNYNSINTNHDTMLNDESTTNDELYLDINLVHDNDMNDLEAMNKASSIPLVVKYDDRNQYVTSIQGKFSNITVKTAEDALISLYSVKTLLGLEDPNTQFILDEENEDRYGKTFTFKQYYDSIEVLGYNITISADHTGKTSSLQSCIIDNKLIKKAVPTTTPKLSVSEIKQLIQEQFIEATRISSSLIIYAEQSSTAPVLAYYCYIRNKMDRSMGHVTVLDAMSGKIIYEDSTSF